MTKTLLCAFLLCFSVIGASAQAQTNYTSNLLKQLLDLPAPPPVNSTGEIASLPLKPERPDGFYDPKNVPPDDAPIEVLLDFWERQNGYFDEFRYNLRPSKETLRRLMEAIDGDHEKLDNFIKLFPTDPDVADFVKKIYLTERETAKTSGSWLDTVRRWLKNNSDMFLNELLTEVREIKEESGRVNNQEGLIALAKVNWNSAKSFIDALERDASQTGTHTLAKYVLYHHALQEENSSDTEKYRAELQQIVADKTASHKARDLAMDALVLGGDFEGRDDWYISILSDETLLELQDDGFTGLTTLVRYSPNDREKWVPLMTKLLNGGSPTLRSVAVRNLLEIKGLNRETALLLLPWLSDREWASGSSDRERIRLITFLEENDIPEGVPGLIRILISEDGYLRSSAAKALVRYKSSSAIPALRSALQDESDTEYRENIIDALIAAGGMSDAEQLAGLEAYAASIANEKEESEDSEEYSENQEDEDKPVSIEVSIGTFLKSCEEPRDSLVSMAVQRIKVLKKTDPKLAGILSGIIQNWKSRIIDLEMLESAGGSKADVEIILKILIRRAGMRERIPNELSMMRDKNAIQRALSAVISENISDQAYILSAADADSKIALLALARLVRAALPVREVGALLNDPNKTLALAAERYLESEDGVEARKLILARRKGEIRILGSQNAFIADEKKNYDIYRELLNDLFNDVNGSDYWNMNLTELNKTENDLRAEFKTNEDLLAIYAFIEDTIAWHKVLRVYKDKIVFTYYETSARYWEKHITSKEYQAMYNFLIQNRIDELAPFSTCGRECRSREFVMFGRDGGRRIFYRQYSTPEPLKPLEEIFDSFNTGERRLHYWIADKLPGVEVLISAENFEARALWKNGADFRVLIEDKKKEKTILEDIEMQEKSEDANVNLTYSQRSEIQRARRSQLAFRHYSWRKFENGQLGSEVSQPAEIAYLSENMQVISWGGKSVYAMTPTTYRRRAGNFEIRTDSNYYSSGNLIKVFDSGATAVFKEGKYANPMVTPDGKWIIAAKGDEDSSRIACIVRINLQTGKEFDVNIPAADDFYPVAFADAHNKMLLYRARDEDSDRDEDNPSPKTPEYYLLDANTGAFQLVKGEFRPLKDQTVRGLQPTGSGREFWAAIYDEKTRATQVGFYDARLFAFNPVLTLPKIELDSMNIFIDKPEAKLYFVYGGHLLSLPFAAAQNQP